MKTDATELDRWSRKNREGKLKMEMNDPGLTVAQLDAELSKPCSLERRAELMWRRGELDNAARAAPPRAEPPTGFTINIPAGLGITDIVDQSGRKFQARAVGDRRVIDVMPSVFLILLTGPHGEDWRRANEGSNIWDRMQPGIHV
jgi:hypothetical protein